MKYSFPRILSCVKIGIYTLIRCPVCRWKVFFPTFATPLVRIATKLHPAPLKSDRSCFSILDECSDNGLNLWRGRPFHALRQFSFGRFNFLMLRHRRFLKTLRASHDRQFSDTALKIFLV